MGRKLFCDINPTCYKISVKKETFRRNLKDFFSSEKIAKEKKAELLPNIVKSHSSILIRKLEGVDMRLQENKVTNIRLAAEKINGIIIKPGETFSLWKTIGKTTEKEGYKEGLVIRRGGKLGADIAGGLCQMANMVHWLVLNSPLTVTELHHHSDALFPDDRRRVPFGTGTSVVNNYVDYRFKNNTEQTVQIVTWIDDGELCGELRSEKPFPCRYKLVEEDHHFRKEGEKYYRISKVYRLVIEKESGAQIRKELILDNHSLVMYDHSLIPKEQIRDD
ncbi:MAG: VanW family protein [Oscillospiraceae bacterium]|nr:VanW family protein [Oscillospiraceae bacterium]